MKLTSRIFCSVVRFSAMIGVLSIAACAQTNTVDSSSTGQGLYEDAGSTGQVSGIGIDSQDIVRITDQMYRDILQNPAIADRELPPRVLIDENGIRNESSSRININLLSDRIRVNLNRSAGGRLVFVSRQNIDLIDKERQLKRDGLVDSGTVRNTKATAGVDFRLFGRVSTLDSVETTSQRTSRYHQIVFELIDMELGTVVWSNLYEFKKTAQDNILYR